VPVTFTSRFGVKGLKNPFYNPAQRRVRAFWRLFIQAVLFLLGIVALSVAIVLAAFAIWLATGQIPSNATGNPAAFSQLIAEKMARSPWIGLLSGLTSLLVMLATYWVAGRFLDRRRFVDFGFHFDAAWWRDLAFGLALGALLMALIFGVELAAGWVTITGTLQSVESGVGLVQGLALFICVGIYEEMLSRGYHLRNIAEGLNIKAWGPKWALGLGYLLSSMVFGMLHLANPNTSLMSTVNLVVAGLFLGLGFVLTGELAISIGLHITWNFFQGSVFGFPVSGGASSASLIAIRQGGPTLWTGGAFGPEAGLIGLSAILLGSALIVGWVRRTRGRVAWQTRLAEYAPTATKVATTDVDSFS
jgi:membrane protease YdiL (CAAX protease family)